MCHRIENFFDSIDSIDELIGTEEGKQVAYMMICYRKMTPEVLTKLVKADPSFACNETADALVAAEQVDMLPILQQYGWKRTPEWDALVRDSFQKEIQNERNPEVKAAMENVMGKLNGETNNV